MHAYSNPVLPEHCTPISPYLIKISSAFNTCVPTHLALLSTTLGFFSIIAWLFAQIPQIIKNWRLKSGSGLSIYFLGEWLLGDLTNLIGAILTKQANWQVGLAIYYVLVDLCLTSQFIWFSYYRDSWTTKISLIDASKKPGQEHPRYKRQDIPSSSSAGSNTGTDKTHEYNRQQSSKTRSTFNVSANTFPVLALATQASASVLPLVVDDQSNVVLADALSAPHLRSIGRDVAWVSALLYLLSRLPQIFKNKSRRSTAGLSAYMFLAAFLGNLLYASAVLTNPLAWSDYPAWGCHGWLGGRPSDRQEWIKSAAPFWVGAAGVLMLDATIGVQFLIYRSRTGGCPSNYGSEQEVMVEVFERDANGNIRGRKRWRETMSGWMRGWMPSPTSLRPYRGSVSQETCASETETEVQREQQPLLTGPVVTYDGGS